MGDTRYQVLFLTVWGAQMGGLFATFPTFLREPTHLKVGTCFVLACVVSLILTIAETIVFHSFRTWRRRVDK